MALWIYRLLLPACLLLALPGWWLKMLRRGGLGSGLSERFGCYATDLEFEPCGAVHVHAVSVGESLLGLKLIEAWQRAHPERDFVLAVATASAHAVARERTKGRCRVVYQPIDLKGCVRRYLERFEPAMLVLVEGEMWPHLMLECEQRQVPVRLVNARMSPRSRRRYARFAAWVRPVFGRLDRVALQEEADADLWQELGVASSRIRTVGSMKFDGGGGSERPPRQDFVDLLKRQVRGRPLVLGASTHPGEEVLIAKAAKAAGGFAVIVPRHAEKREQVRSALAGAGLEMEFRSGGLGEARVDGWVIDTTGELRDWTALADVVVIGKSFRGIGGQTPAEAVLERKALMFGPHMENFEPLASQLVACGGAWRIEHEEALESRLRDVLSGRGSPDPLAAAEVLERHTGSIMRTIEWLEQP